MSAVNLIYREQTFLFKISVFPSHYIEYKNFIEDILTPLTLFGERFYLHRKRPAVKYNLQNNKMIVSYMHALY